MTRLRLHSLASRPNAVVGGLLVASVLFSAVVGFFFTPYDPIAVDFDNRLSAPSTSHWLGTDEWGRDTLSRILSGAVVSVGVALATALIATALGSLIGVTSAYLGRWLDKITMSLMDALLAFPSIVLALAVVTIAGFSLYTPIIALSIAYLPSVVRVVRASALSLVRNEYIEASVVMGNSRLFTLVRHLLPNTVGTVIVLTTSLFGWALLAESALSFLGLGVPPPAATWGGMLADSRNYFEDAPWLALAPGLALSAALLGINLLGDALRDYFDPRMQAA